MNMSRSNMSCRGAACSRATGGVSNAAPIRSTSCTAAAITVTGRFRSLPWHKLFFIVDGPLADLLVGGYRLDRVYAVPGVPQLRRYFEEMRELGYGGPAVDRRAAVIFHEFAEACAGTLREAAESVRPEIAGLKRALDSRHPTAVPP